MFRVESEKGLIRGKAVQDVPIHESLTMELPENQLITHLIEAEESPILMNLTLRALLAGCKHGDILEV
jgi:hypothetical protein